MLGILPRFVVAGLVGLFLTVISGVSFSWADGKQQNVLRLTILYMNDPHAYYASRPSNFGSGVTGGFAKAQSLIREIRKINEREGRQTLFLLAGDLLTGTTFSTVFKGAMGTKLLNVMKVDAMVVGNHEFDYGVENLLKEIKSKAEFPLLSANIFDTHGGLLFERFVLKRFGNFEAVPSVVIMGLTTEKTPSISSPKNVEGIKFTDPQYEARSILDGIAPDSLVIALTHLGLMPDKELATACPRINVIIGGHSHTIVREPIRVSNTLICQAGAYSEYLGRLDLDFKDGKIIWHSGKLMELGSEIKEDSEISELIRSHEELMGPEFERIIAQNNVDMEASRSAVRSEVPNTLARVIAALMAESVGAEVALINGGAIRAGLRKGPIKLSDVFATLPFDDAVVKIDIKGSDLESALRMSHALPTGSGGKLHAFGLEFHAHPSSGLKIQKVHGKDFDPSATYGLAIGEFLASGGDGYLLFRDVGKNRMESGLLIRDLLTNFMVTRSPVTRRKIDSIIKPGLSESAHN